MLIYHQNLSRTITPVCVAQLILKNMTSTSPLNFSKLQQKSLAVNSNWRCNKPLYDIILLQGKALDHETKRFEGIVNVGDVNEHLYC